MAIIDAAAALLDYLQNSSDAAALAIRNSVVGGADGICDTADEIIAILNSQAQKRRDDNTPNLALLIAIQDAGEDLTGTPGCFEQHIVVRVFDRQSGLSNIRAVRELLVPLLRNRPFNLGAQGGIMKTAYTGRTGHLLDVVSAVHYEATTFVADVVRQL